MATKKFKALPKDSQRAAFAQMDKDGTRRAGGRSASVIFSAKNSERLKGLRSGTIAATDFFNEKIKPIRVRRDEALKIKSFYEQSRSTHLEGYNSAKKAVQKEQRNINKQYESFSKLEAARQSFKFPTKRAKQGKLF